jgi:hypothetical protein
MEKLFENIYKQTYLQEDNWKGSDWEEIRKAIGKEAREKDPERSDCDSLEYVHYKICDLNDGPESDYGEYILEYFENSKNSKRLRHTLEMLGYL